jgi:hypothetical protein
MGPAPSSRYRVSMPLLRRAGVSDRCFIRVERGSSFLVGCTSERFHRVECLGGTDDLDQRRPD